MNLYVVTIKTEFGQKEVLVKASKEKEALLLIKQDSLTLNRSCYRIKGVKRYTLFDSPHVIGERW